MIGFIIVLHVIICILLAIIILMQSGRGGGLTEAFSSAETVFGSKTNEVLIKGTTVFALLFLVTSLSLAIVSSKKGKSIITEEVLSKIDQEAKTAAKEHAAQAGVAATVNMPESVPAGEVDEAQKAVATPPAEAK